MNPVTKGSLVQREDGGNARFDAALDFADCVGRNPEPTRRFLDRMGYGFSDDRQIRRFFESGLPADYRVYGWYHWLLLEHGKNHCRKQPVCEGCVFSKVCPGRAL